MASGEAEAVSSWRTYDGLKRSMETLRSTLKIYGIDLIAPVEHHVWAEIRGLESSPEGTMP